MINKIMCRSRKDRKSSRKISLTFDDGPHRFYTPKILDILKAFRVKATFFIVGKNAQKYPDIVKRIHREGHDIGNHTFSHPVSPFIKLRKKQFIKEEIIKTDNIIESIIGSRPYLFRPPLAFWDMNVDEFIAEAQALGHLPVGWSRSSVDWLGNPWIIKYNVLNGKKADGDIMLLHDGAEKALVRKRDATVQTLPQIIDDCKNRRFDPLALTDLLKE